MKEYKLRVLQDGINLQELSDLLGSTVAAYVYAARGLVDSDAIKEFTGLFSLLPSDELYNLPAAWARIKKHIDAKSKIAVYGDYDADGALASTILWRFLYKTLSASAIVYIPDRHEEGYGLNKNAVEDLVKQGYSLIITVDCGVRDNELIGWAEKEFPIEFVVTDHHQPGDTFPECPTVHPLFPEHTSKNAFTSGGVVAWKLVRYIETQLKLGTGYSDSVVDLAGISLVTDMMPLTGENRTLVKLALRKLRVQSHLGIKAIMDVSQLRQDEIAAYHLGYVIGPHLNASGRIGDPYASTRLLCTDKPEVARKLALEVHEINIKRQELTKQMLVEAEKNKIVIQEKLILVSGHDWDDGIIGLVAGKLMNAHDKPTLAVAIDTKAKSAKGSARSLGEFNITEFLEEIKDQFSRYGGHHSAAGFSLVSDDIEVFQKRIAEHLLLAHSTYVPIMTKEVDAILEAKDLTDAFFTALQQLEPYGIGNFQPLFALTGTIGQFSTVGQLGNHVKMEIVTASGNITVMLFDGTTKCAGIHQGDTITVVGKPKQEEYMGRKQTTFIAEEIVPNKLIM